MSDEQEQAHIDIDGQSVRISGEKREVVDVGPGQVRVKDGESEIRVTWTGVHIRDGKTSLKINIWKPVIACAVGLVILVAVLTATVVGIIKLMM